MGGAVLATVDDLLTYLGRADEAPISQYGEPADYSALVQSLELASGKIRGEARQYLEPVEGDTVTLRGTFHDTLWLPERPVTAVDSIAVDGVTVPAVLYNVSPNGAVTSRGVAWANTVVNLRESAPTPWGDWYSVITVTYDHGYEVVPDDLRALCLDLAARTLATPAGGATSSVTIGNYSESAGTPGGGGANLSDDERELARRYRPAAGTIAARAY